MVRGGADRALAPAIMKQSAVRLGSVLYPLLAACALTGLPACTDSSSADDANDPMTDAPPAQPAAPGDLDKSFGNQGMKELDIGSGNAAAIAMQGNKPLVCYTAVTPTGAVGHVARFTPDGSLDPSFADGGIYSFTAEALPASGCTDVAVLRDGSIIMSIHTNNTNFTLPLSADGTLLSTADLAMGYTTRLEPMHTSDGVMAAGLKGTQVEFASRSNNTTNTVSFAADIASVGAMVLSPADWPLVVANAKDSAGPVWQLLSPAGSVMTNLASLPTLGTSTPDLIHGAMFLQDGSIMAFGSVDNDREVMAVRFSIADGATTTAEHHAADGVAQAHAGTLDAAGGAILVGSAGPAGKPVFAWQRYVNNTVVLDPAYQHAGLATVAPPSGSAELVDVVESNGSLFALGTFDSETAAPRMVLLKITE